MKPGATCRFLETHRQCQVLDTFIDAIQREYTETGEALYKADPQSPLLQIPLARSPVEFGWALYGSDRTADHTHLKQSNTLFGLFYSTIRTLFGKDKYRVYQCKVLDVGDPYSAQTAEYLTSEIGRSFWYQGGLNPALAGTIPMKGAKKAITLPDFDHLFREVKQDIVNRAYVKDNITFFKQQQEETIKVLDNVAKRSVESTPSKAFILTDS